MKAKTDDPFKSCVSVLSPLGANEKVGFTSDEDDTVTDNIGFANENVGFVDELVDTTGSGLLADGTLAGEKLNTAAELKQ